MKSKSTITGLLLILSPGSVFAGKQAISSFSNGVEAKQNAAAFREATPKP